MHSALDAVGLTAAFATALAAAGISCNVLAGYHHDHVLVDTDRASEAVSVLERLAAFARQDDGDPTDHHPAVRHYHPAATPATMSTPTSDKFRCTGSGVGCWA